MILYVPKYKISAVDDFEYIEANIWGISLNEFMFIEYN